jgi:hypothetical protein
MYPLCVILSHLLETFSVSKLKMDVSEEFA